MVTLERVKEIFEKVVRERGLYEDSVLISFRPLKPEETIGNPKRDDFPIVIGKEKVIEASFKEAKAHVFTDSPVNYSGHLREILKLNLRTNEERAVFVGALNAVLKFLDIVEKTIHCKDKEPFECGKKIAKYLIEKKDVKKIGLIGFNPGILEGLVDAFGPKALRVTDLNTENVGKKKFGVPIWDGNSMTERLIQEVDFILVTGTTFVNGTYEGIHELIEKHGKNHLIYGVTGIGICTLLSLNSICPYGRY
ncbi:MAG: DUF364 domain-containing protein [Deltaproteobacteria bacterium]|nr:DUF364 domain-containing protein [Deltaproteobacteria bacterium]